MICNKVEELLPLFISGDLSPLEMDEVRRHIDSCEACEGTAALLAEDTSWLSETGAPAFDESELAAIRSSVNRRLDDESAAPGLLDLLAGFLTWRPVLAAAAIIIIALIYTFSDWTTAPEKPLIVRDAEIRDGGVIEDPKPAGKKSRIQQKRKNRNQRNSSKKHVNLMASAEPRATERTIDSHVPMRIELQTADPNIRIIWLAQAAPAR